MFLFASCRMWLTLIGVLRSLVVKNKNVTAFIDVLNRELLYDSISSSFFD